VAQTILIVDAEPVVRSVITAILQSGGYAVLESDNVQQGLDILKTAPVDLLMTNVNLPGISGADAMSVFKGVRPDLKVLMIAGVPDDQVIREWVCDHHFQVFPKPFSAGHLLQKVHSLLKDEPQPALGHSDGA
jgi:DNA-binding NtrC family response regulator